MTNPRRMIDPTLGLLTHWIRVGSLVSTLTIAPLVVGQESGVIQNISIQATGGVDFPGVLDLLGIREGERFDEVALDQGLARLALTGDYQIVRGRFDDSTGNLELKLSLHNRLKEIRINLPGLNRDRGVEEYLSQDIRKAVGLSEGEVVSREQIPEIRTRVEAAVSRRGFRDFDVVVVFTGSSESTLRSVEITVNGQGAQYLKGLAFVGFTDGEYRDWFGELRGEESLRSALTGIGISGFRSGILAKPMIYDLEALSNARDRFVKGMRDEGYYDVGFQISIEGGPENAILTFALNKGPRHEVHIEGVTAFWERDLRQKLLERSVRLGLPFNVVEASLRLQRIYREIGFADVVVDREVIETGSVKRIIFKIKQGRQYFFRRVEFKGARPSELEVLNDAVASWLAPMKTPFHHIYYYPDAIVGSLGGFIAALRDKGFLDVAIVAFDFVPQAKGSRFLTLQLNVRLGRRYRIRNVNVLGNLILTPEELNQIVRVESGDYVSPSRVLSVSTDLRREYQERGFMSVEVPLAEQDLFSFPKEKGVVDINYQILPGPKVRVGRVIVDGANKTKDQVVTRELNQFSLIEGEAMDPSGVADLEQRLLGLGLFSSVDTKPVNGRILERGDVGQGKPELQEKDLRVAVRERPGGAVEFGPGYRTDLGAIAFAELNYRNLGGWNRSVFLRSQVSRKLKTYQFLEQKYSIVYLEPYLFDWRVRLRTELDYSKSDDVQYDRSKNPIAGFNSQETRARISVERELFKDFFWTQNLYDFAIAEISDIVTEPQNPENYYQIASTGLSFRYDKRNNIFNPTSGFALVHFVSLAMPELGGDSDAHFLHWRQQYNGYIALGKESSLALSGTFSRIWGLHQSQQIPENRRLVLGGRSSIRSLPERYLRFDQDSIVDQQSFNLRAEYRQPIFLDWGAAVFVEGGQVEVIRTKGRPLDSYSTGFRKAAGLGFRYATPVGPVALDFGYNMDFRPGENRYRFNLSIGSF